MTTKHFFGNATRRDARDYVEEGAAFLAMISSGSTAATRRQPVASQPIVAARQPQRIDVVVIGAGQAGLSVGYHLKRHNLSFVILEADERIGDVWRRCWDSLRLFTPARYDSLDGMPSPQPASPFRPRTTWPTISKPMRYDLRCRYIPAPGSSASSAWASAASSRRGTFRSTRRMSWWRWRTDIRKSPALPANSTPDIVQLHSSAYRSPAQLSPGAVLIAGAGNVEAAEIGLELARSGHRVVMSGRDTGHLPFGVSHGFLGRNLLGPLVLKGCCSTGSSR